MRDVIDQMADLTFGLPIEVVQQMLGVIQKLPCGVIQQITAGALELA